MTEEHDVPQPASSTSSAGSARPPAVAAPGVANYSGLASEHVRAEGWHPTVAQLADWNALFTAVKARLRSIATTPDLPRSWPAAEVRRHPVTEGVLDCVNALDQLHAQLMQRGDERAQLPPRTEAAGATPSPMVSAEADSATRVAAGGNDGTAAVPTAHVPRGRLPPRTLASSADLAHAISTARPVPAADVLAWMPGEAFLRRRIACDASQDTSRAEGFALLRLEFPELDVRTRARRLLDDAAQPGGSASAGRAQPDMVPSVRDALLIAIAARLRGALKRQDVITRLSADEFCCLLIGASSPESLASYVSRVVSAVSLPFAIEGAQWIVRPVFGVSSFPEDGSTADELLRFASTEQDDLSWWRRTAVLPEQDDDR